jgi:protein arginine kinase activator
MKCDHCKKNDATIHISQTVNGKTTEQHLCAQCAAELGVNNSFNQYFSELFEPGSPVAQSIFDTAGGIPAFGSSTAPTAVCPVCGQRYDEFRRSGLLGCSNCYKAFGDRLDAIFRRVQGGTRHTGRKACETAEHQEMQLYRHKLLELKQQLQQYVADEEYEKAASVRDEIKEVSKQLEDFEKQIEQTDSNEGNHNKERGEDK